MSFFYWLWERNCHHHDWKDVPTPSVKDLADAGIEQGRPHVDWNYVLLGQTCECGARRIYEGPALGWRILK